jgi:hypothetical protein
LKNSDEGNFGPEGDEQAVGPTADADVEQMSGKKTDRGGRGMTAQWRMRERMQFLNPARKLATKQSINHSFTTTRIGRKRGDWCECDCRQEGRGGGGEDKTRIGYLQTDGMEMSVILLIRRTSKERRNGRIFLFFS